MHQLARIILIKGWGCLLLQELCNLRELGIKTGLVLMMCWCLQENRVFSQLGESDHCGDPEHKAVQAPSKSSHSHKIRGVWNAGSGKYASVHLPSSPLLPISMPSMSGLCLEPVQEQLRWLQDKAVLINRLFLVRWSLGNSSAQPECLTGCKDILNWGLWKF